MFYRQVSSVLTLESLPSEAVVFFDGMAAVKSKTGQWLITGEKTPVTSKILGGIASVFHVVSEYSYFPVTGFDSQRVNLTHVMQFISHYGEIPWVVVFEWTRDFFGVSLDTARDAVWELVRTEKVEPTSHETLRIAR